MRIFVSFEIWGLQMGKLRTGNSYTGGKSESEVSWTSVCVVPTSAVVNDKVNVNLLY
jgi:hypothetical protein